MKMQTEKLAGPALDWAFGQIDPQCEDLNWVWSVRDGVMLGVAPENGFPIVFIPESTGLIARMRQKAKIGADVYSPSTDANKAMQLMIDLGISVDNMQAPAWAASFRVPVKCADEKLSPSYCRHRGDTPMQAVVRCVVFKVMGAEIDVPDALVSGK